MSIECPTCQQNCDKSEYARHHLNIINANLKDKPEPVCRLFSLRTFRGIEGVVDHRQPSRMFVGQEPLLMRDNRG